jgi:hypothetical protein
VQKSQKNKEEMKKQNKLFIISGLILLFSSPAFAANPEVFHKFAELTFEGQGKYSVPIPAEMLPEISSEASMRILDNKNREIPFIIFKHQDVQTTLTITATIFNKSISEKDHLQNFELALNSAPTINKLSLEIGENVFNRTVTLYGKVHQRDQYQLIKTNLRILSIQDPDNQINYRNTELNFPQQNVNFYKVSISLEPGESPLTISKATLLDRSFTEGLRFDEEMEISQLTEKDLKKLSNLNLQRENVDLFFLTPKHSGLPLNQIILKIDDVNFSRSASLYDYSSGKIFGPSLINSTNLFNYPNSSNSDFEFPDSRSSRYLLQIFQGDDRPIKLSTATGSNFVHEIIFIAEEDPNYYEKPFRIYFDSRKPRIPVYDIAERIRKEKVEKYQPAIIGEVVVNPQFQAEPPKELPKSEQIPYLLYLTVGALVLVLGGYLIRLLKVSPPTE